MTLDPQFPWWILSNAIGSFAAGVAVLIACTASKKLSHAIVKWRTSRLPKGPDAERVREELERMVEDLHAVGRVKLLLLRTAALRREIVERTTERAGAANAAERSPQWGSNQKEDHPPAATQLAFTFGTPEPRGNASPPVNIFLHFDEDNAGRDDDGGVDAVFIHSTDRGEEKLVVFQNKFQSGK